MNRKTKAIVLCIFLGGFGAHHYYLNRPFIGLLYTLFCWTFIPALLSLIDLVILFLTPRCLFKTKEQ